MLNKVRAPLARVLDPVARGLARLGVSPDAVTVVGTLGVSAAALVFFPRGRFFVGTLVILLFVFSDLVDGALARYRGGGTAWGAFLDSTLDRVGDATVFSGIVLYYAGQHEPRPAALALYCLVAGTLTSYVRARAEGLGLTASVGIVERAERLIVVLTTAALSDLFGVRWLLVAGLWVLAVGSTITVGQRYVTVWRQSHATKVGAPRR